MCWELNEIMHKFLYQTFFDPKSSIKWVTNIIYDDAQNRQ